MERNSSRLLEDCARGIEDAEATVFDQYAKRLVAFTRKRIWGKFKNRFDPEDVVLSAYVVFYRGARTGAFEWKRSGDLWRILVGITLKRLLKRISFEKKQKRNPEREVCDSDFHDLLSDADSPEAEVILTDQLASFLGDLNPTEQRVVELRLDGRSIADIREKLVEESDGQAVPSESTVRRVVKEARKELERRLESD